MTVTLQTMWVGEYAEGDTVLQALAVANVLQVLNTPDGILLTEACNHHFSVYLTPDQLQQLIAELQAL